MQDLMRFLPGLTLQLEDNETAREAFAFAAWRRTAGEAIGDKTAPLELVKERLVVAVTDDVWKRNLEALAGQMVFRINSALRMQIVSFIEFKVDENAVRIENEQRPRPKPAEDDSQVDVGDEVRAAAESIKDEELREHFLLAAERCLARKARMEK